MTLLDIAQSMHGKLRDGYSAPQAGAAVEGESISYGTATADSVDGFVPIIMDNAPTDEPGYDPADYTFTVACDAPISQGDRVAYITINGVGKAVSLGTLSSIADGAASTAEAAETAANNIAQATGQYFFHDTNGAHVCSSANNPNSGRNVILNALGLLFRNGTTNLAYFQPTSIALGMNSTTGEGEGDESSVFISLLNQAKIAMVRETITLGGISVGFLTKSLNLLISGGDAASAFTHVDKLYGTDAYISANQIYMDSVFMSGLRGMGATLTNSAAQNISTSYSKLTLGNSIVAPTKIGTSPFSKSSNGIKCAYAGTVDVSAMAYGQSMGSGNNLAIEIRKGSTSICEAINGTGAAGLATVSITPRAITVAAGDVLYLYAKSTTAVTGAIPAGEACLNARYI